MSSPVRRSVEVIANPHLTATNGDTLPTIFHNGDAISLVPGGKGGDTLVVNPKRSDSASDCEIRHVEIYDYAMSAAEIQEKTREIFQQMLPCPSDEFQLVPPSAFQLRVCARYSECEPGEYISEEGTDTTDRRCEQCTAG